MAFSPTYLCCYSKEVEERNIVVDIAFAVCPAPPGTDATHPRAVLKETKEDGHAYNLLNFTKAFTIGDVVNALQYELGSRGDLCHPCEIVAPHFFRTTVTDVHIKRINFTDASSLTTARQIRKALNKEAEMRFVEEQGTSLQKIFAAAEVGGKNPVTGVTLRVDMNFESGRVWCCNLPLWLCVCSYRICGSCTGEFEDDTGSPVPLRRWLSN